MKKCPECSEENELMFTGGQYMCIGCVGTEPEIEIISYKDNENE